MGTADERSGTPQDVDGFLEQEAKKRADPEESLAEITDQPHVAEKVPETLGLEQVGKALRQLDENLLDEAGVEKLRARSVTPGELLGAGEGVMGELAGKPVEAGRGVSRVEGGEFRVEQYGYLGLSEGRLEVLSPLWIDARRMTVRWLLLDEKARPVTREMLLKCLANRGVVKGLQEQEIERTVAQVAAGSHCCGGVEVAAGREPKHGQNSLVQLLVESEGEEADEPVVREQEVVARRRLATRGTNGFDVGGAMLEARDGRDEKALAAGDNMVVERKGNVEIFKAAASGILRCDAGKIAVVRVLSVDGPVGFNTGNLDFEGQVRIDGSVARGFSVKAEDHVIIAGSVDPGATVQAKGDVEVSGGISGNRTKVLAGGSVRAQSVEDGTVMAQGNILLSDYASRAMLVAGGQVRIARGESRQGGSMMGGQAWARQGVELYVVGSRGGFPTILAGGLGRQQGEKLDEIKDNLEVSYNQMVRCLERLGMTRVDASQLKNMIAAEIGPRRKLLMHTGQRLAKIVRLYKNLLKNRKALKAQIETYAREATIEIREHAYPGVKIRIGEHTHEIMQQIEEGLLFRLVDGKLTDVYEADRE